MISILTMYLPKGLIMEPVYAHILFFLPIFKMIFDIIIKFFINYFISKSEL